MTKTMIVERGKRVVVCSFFIWWAVQSRAFVVVSAARAYCENGSLRYNANKKKMAGLASSSSAFRGRRFDFTELAFFRALLAGRARGRRETSFTRDGRLVDEVSVVWRRRAGTAVAAAAVHSAVVAVSSSTDVVVVIVVSAIRTAAVAIVLVVVSRRSSSASRRAARTRTRTRTRTGTGTGIGTGMRPSAFAVSAATSSLATII
jgi:hypothetical protein